MGLEVLVAPSMRKEEIHRAPLRMERKAQEGLVQGQYEGCDNSEGERGGELWHGFQQDQPRPH